MAPVFELVANQYKSTICSSLNALADDSQGDRTEGSADATAMETTAVAEEEEETVMAIDEPRFEMFKKSLTGLFRESRAQSIAMSRLRQHLADVTAAAAAPAFTRGEIGAAFERMTDANQIMVADDIIFLI